MSQKKVRIGIVGTGNNARMHEAGYSEIPAECQIVAVCDVIEKVARKRAEPYQAKVYTDYHELVADPDVDMVDVITPHRWHYPISLAALEQRKHVLVEKPMTLSSEEALQLINTAQAMGVKFTVAENTHLMPAYIEAERLLQEGALGEIRFVRTHIAGSEVASIKNPTDWLGKPGNYGVLFDSGVHSFYLMKWLFGGVRDIQAIPYKIIPESQVDDHTIAFGHLANGAIFETVQSCIIEAPWTERLEVYGSKATLIADQLVDPPLLLINGSEDIDGTPIASVPYEPLAWKYLSIMAEVQDFVHAVLEDRAPVINPMYGYHAVQVAEAAYKSMAEGRPVSV